MKDIKKTIFEKLRLSDGMKNVAKISSGTMAGQIISMVTLPIFTRVYGAEVIGNWAVFNSVATIVNSFSDMGLSNAIMIEEDEDGARRVYEVISTIVLIISLISGIAAFVFYTLYPEESGISTLFIAVTITVLIITSQQSQVCYTWLNREGRYDILMKNPVINQVLIAVFALALAFLGVRKYGYYIGLIVGQFGTIIHMKRFMPRKMFTFKKEDYITVLKKHQTFWKYQLPTNLITNVKNQLPTLLIKGFFGSKILGYYSVSLRILNIPINLLAVAIGRVFFKNASDLKREGGDVGEYTYNNVIKAMKMSMLIIIGLMSVGDVAITIYFGADYQPAGQMLRIVMLQNFFMFIVMASQGITVVLDKLNYTMLYNVAQCVCNVIALCAGAYIFRSIYAGLWMMTVFYVVVQTVYFCALFRVMKISVVRYLKSIAVNMALIFGCTAVIRLVLLWLGLVKTI